MNLVLENVRSLLVFKIQVLKVSRVNMIHYIEIKIKTYADHVTLYLFIIKNLLTGIKIFLTIT